MTPILLTQETAEVSPVFLIVFVAAVIGLTFFSMKKTSDNAVALLKKRYEGKVVAECNLNTKMRYCFVTKDEFVIQFNQNCFIAFPLANIAYVQSFRDIATRQWTFAIWDKDKKQKSLDGKLLSGKQNTKKYKGSTLFMIPQNDADKLCEFIITYAPHIQLFKK